jgi:hypothetical protein
MPEFFELLSAHWSTLTGLATLLGALLVFWLGSYFPRRKEVEANDQLLRDKEAALELRVGAQDLLIKEMFGELKNIAERVKSIDEKLHWRIGALENQVTILLRGHLEWEDKG